jgi:hypothetical protein
MNPKGDASEKWTRLSVQTDAPARGMQHRCCGAADPLHAIDPNVT